MKVNYGTHINKGKFPRMSDALADYRILHPEADVVQVFAVGPRSSKVTIIHPEEYSFIKDLRLRLYIHSCYLTHLWSEKKPLRSAARTIVQR